MTSGIHECRQNVELEYGVCVYVQLLFLRGLLFMIPLLLGFMGDASVSDWKRTMCSVPSRPQVMLKYYRRWMQSFGLQGDKHHQQTFNLSESSGKSYDTMVLSYCCHGTSVCRRRNNPHIFATGSKELQLSSRYASQEWSQSTR